MTPTLLSRLQLALAVSALTSITSAQTQPFYTVEFLGVATAATGLNDSGLAIGWTSSAGANLRGWVAGNGSGVTLLPLPPGRASSMVYGINDAGVIVGHVATGSSPEFSGVAAVWTPIVGGGYSVQELGTLPGSAVSRAVAINNGNDIVGFSVAGIFHRPVRFVAPGVVQDLSATGIADPKSINDQRVLVDATGKRLDLNTMLVQNLGVPTGLPSSYVAVYPNAINAPNQVVGAAVLATSGNCSRQAARYTDGIGWEILSGCGQYNDAHGINDAGDVVMRIGTAPYVRFQGWSTRRVEDLIANTVGHWVPYNTFYSLEINNTGQVVLPASNATTGQSGMVLLTPRPAGYASFGTGCLGPNGLVPSLAPVGGDVPRIGTTSMLRVSGLPSVLCVVAYVYGFSNTFAVGPGGQYPLPFDLAVLGWPGCQQLVSLDIVTNEITTTGSIDHPLVVPYTLSWVGFDFHVQSVVLYTPTGVAVSNGLVAQIGF